MNHKEALCYAFGISEKEFDEYKKVIEKNCEISQCTLRDVSECCCLFKEKLRDIVDAKKPIR